MKKNLFSIFCLALLMSCTKPIKFNGEQTDPKLVINSLVEAGQPVSANISKSYFFLDTEENTMAPDDLVASLYVNDRLIGEMTPHYDTFSINGWYLPDLGYYHVVKVFTHPYCPSEGDIVKVSATANGFDNVEGVTSPLPNEFVCQWNNYNITYWNKYFYVDEVGEDTVWIIDVNLDLNIEITDPNPGQMDFFRILVRVGSYGDYLSESSNFYIGVTYDDPIFGNISSETGLFDDYSSSSSTPGVFTDQLFDSKSYQLKLPLSAYITIKGHPDPDFFSVPIQIEHITKEYYYYLNTCNQENEIMQFFTEPVQTYSNVDGGYGLVGGRALDSLLFRLPLEE